MKLSLNEIRPAVIYLGLFLLIMYLTSAAIYMAFLPNHASVAAQLTLKAVVFLFVAVVASKLSYNLLPNDEYSHRSLFISSVFYAVVSAMFVGRDLLITNIDGVPLQRDPLTSFLNALVNVCLFYLAGWLWLKRGVLMQLLLRTWHEFWKS
jgi:hypothetical protein